MNRFPTLIKGTTRGEELSFKLSFVAIGPLVLALRRVQTDRQTDGQTDNTCFGKLGKAQRLRLWEYGLDKSVIGLSPHKKQLVNLWFTVSG